MELRELLEHAAKIRKDLFGMTTYIVRNDSPNPYYCRSQQGLLLVQYYGSPGKIGTPIGGWCVTGGGHDARNGAWLAEATEKYGLIPLVPTYNCSNGTYGPILGITKTADGIILPEPQLPPYAFSMCGVRTDLQENTYEGCVEQWEAISRGIDWLVPE